mgnify:CR=1 FL=1
MPYDDTNIYKTARQKAGITREKAAEAMGISVESLKAYETYGRLPSCDVVDRMCLGYDALYLAYQHNRLASGEIKVAEVQIMELPLAAIRIINRVQAFAEAHRDRQLLCIAEDGTISEEERPLFDEIMSELDELVKAAVELKLSRTGGRE